LNRAERWKLPVVCEIRRLGERNSKRDQKKERVKDMYGRQFNLFTLFGFRVRIDMSWIIIAILVAWSLSSGYFPVRFENLSTRTYWIMGIIGAAGLFLSIIFHEMAHSLVARRFGMPMKGITLFIFGGIAEMSREPPSPKAEFFMAVVGPLSSFAMAFLLYGVYAAGLRQGWPVGVTGVTMYLSAINGLLGLFNLVPAFPLDGGRVLRSILWKGQGKSPLGNPDQLPDRVGLRDSPDCHRGLFVCHREFHRRSLVVPDRHVHSWSRLHVLPAAPGSPGA
jgi:Zn-dependent protease